MSMMRMVTKMALGFAVAKGMQKVSEAGGIGKVMESLSGGGAGGQGGLADMLGGLTGGQGGAGGGGLADMLGSLTGGQGGQAGGGLADMLGGLTGGQAGGQGGSLADMLTQAGGAGGALGGLGGLLGGLASARGGNGSSLESLLSQEMPEQEPTEDETGSLMIRAMLMAARSDGEIDDAERSTLLDTLGSDAGQDEMEVVQAAMREPIDPAALAADTPKGMETQVYTMSLMAITPDHAAEAQYLHDLAGAMGIAPQTVNDIHGNFGVPKLYS